MHLEGQANQRGYAMAAVLVGVAIMSIVMSALLPVWRQQVQREKEAELAFRGEQYARAIYLFQRANGGRNPPQPRRPGLGTFHPQEVQRPDDRGRRVPAARGGREHAGKPRRPCGSAWRRTATGCAAARRCSDWRCANWRRGTGGAAAESRSGWQPVDRRAESGPGRQPVDRRAESGPGRQPADRRGAGGWRRHDRRQQEQGSLDPHLQRRLALQRVAVPLQRARPARRTGWPRRSGRRADAGASWSWRAGAGRSRADRRTGRRSCRRTGSRRSRSRARLHAWRARSVAVPSSRLDIRRSASPAGRVVFWPGSKNPDPGARV